MPPSPRNSRSGLAVRLKDTFRSLRRYNFRVWAIGAPVASGGTWMQRIGPFQVTKGHWIWCATRTVTNGSS